MAEAREFAKFSIDSADESSLVPSASRAVVISQFSILNSQFRLTPANPEGQ